MSSRPTIDRKIVLTMPATVEGSTANVYGDAIEWFHRNIPGRDRSSCRCIPTMTGDSSGRG